MKTVDTKRIIEEGDEVFFNENTGDYFDTKEGMIKDAYDSGLSKEDVHNALDLDGDEYDCGYMYMTEYWN